MLTPRIFGPPASPRPRPPRLHFVPHGVNGRAPPVGFVRLAVSGGALAIALCPGTAAVASVQLTAAERAAAQTITPETLRAHIRFLASDLLEGRGPATRGDQLAELYVASQLESLGLKPGANGSW